MSACRFSLYLLMLMGSISFGESFQHSKAVVPWSSRSRLNPMTIVHGRRQKQIKCSKGRRKPSAEEKSRSIQKQNGPKRTRSIRMKLDDSPLTVVMVEVDDENWWKEQHDKEYDESLGTANKSNKEDTPFGARLWPCALKISQILAQHDNLEGRTVIDVGCGIGLVSLVAARKGATTIAADISPLVLSLTSQGWSQTQALASPGAKQNGSLTTVKFDVTADDPIPWPASSTTENEVSLPPIVILANMMYEAALSKALAHRVMEAMRSGAWVILGDDDTGFRDGGRQFFEAEMLRLLGKEWEELSKGAWTPSSVKSKEMGWREKRVNILQLKGPYNLK